MNSWSVGAVHDGACQVRDVRGDHVGNLKWIQGAWKFKAIGHDERGAVVPGGGPLTDRHNTVFASLDLEQINKVLGSAFDGHPTVHEPNLSPER